MGIRSGEDRFDLERVNEATEVMVSSTIRQVQPVSAVDTPFTAGTGHRGPWGCFDQLVGCNGSLQEIFPMPQIHHKAKSMASERSIRIVSSICGSQYSMIP